MLDFYYNTYYVERDELPEVLKLLTQHPEYKGLYGPLVKATIDERGTNLQEYLTLSETLQNYFEDYDRTRCFLDNEYITHEMLKNNSDIVKIAEIYSNDDCIQHFPMKSLLHELTQLDKHVMRFE